VVRKHHLEAKPDCQNINRRFKQDDVRKIATERQRVKKVDMPGIQMPLVPPINRGSPPPLSTPESLRKVARENQELMIEAHREGEICMITVGAKIRGNDVTRKRTTKMDSIYT
jgi:hypothetical protein